MIVSRSLAARHSYQVSSIRWAVPSGNTSACCPDGSSINCTIKKYTAALPAIIVKKVEVSTKDSMVR